MSAPGGIDPLFLDLQAALAGRYSLDRELGRGGMGIVYLARDVSLDRPVAIKLLPPDLAARPALRERFLREARTAARLSHPNIVPIHAVDEAGQLVYFVMTYVPGESLGQRLRAGGPLPVAETSRILRDVAWALGHAHTQGVVHRDVKPDNILLEPGGRRALIADFGIAAPVRIGPDPEDGVVGTVAYLSPEQAGGEPCDGRSDLFALGVVGYYALAGRLPYPATTLPELLTRQAAGPPAPLGDVAAHVPRALARTVERCLAHDPAARFQSGEELADALEQLGSVRTDLPAPLRVWLSQGTRRRGTAMVIAAIWGLPLLLGGVLAAVVGPAGGRAAASLAVAAAALGLPWVAYGGIRLYHTRRLLAAGYSHDDIVQALATHVERRREELAFEHGSVPTTIAKVRTGLVLSLLGLSAGSAALAVVLGGGAAGPLGTAALTGALGSAALYYGLGLVPGARGGARDRLAEFGHRFWKGPVGRWLTRLAGWQLRTRAAPDELVHRPTELALGQAAEALFKALPGAQRRDLRDIPAQIEFLSRQAQVVRHRLEELDDLIATAAPTTVFGERSSAGGDGGAAELRQARELYAGQLREIVSTLESLRLGLLKLHAGSAMPSSLTADLQAARALMSRLDLLAQGQAEVNRTLSGPQAPE